MVPPQDIVGAAVDEMLAKVNQAELQGHRIRVEISRSAYSEGRSRSNPGEGRCFACGELGHWYVR
jgi:hypothetical protein